MPRIISRDTLYPKKLKRLADSPRQLFMDGDCGLLNSPTPVLAVVGSRKTSAYGQVVTKQLVKEIAARGVIIVSGLAFGVDSLAHKATLEVGAKTIAVLPGGLDNIYPRNHIGLARQIVEKGGLLISEFPPKTDIFKHNFIARNRIIAGLADGILITEAAIKSGSLHTANFGLEIGLDIFAVPGPITNINSAGCNNLIKSGARPVTEASDVLEALGLHETAEKAEVVASSANEHIILSLIKQGVSDCEQLQIESKLEVIDFQQTISMLEISGKIVNVGGGRWMLK